MQPVTSGGRRKGIKLTGHRRVGLTSFAILLLGSAWLSSVVAPGLQKSTSAQQETKATAVTAGVDALKAITALNPNASTETVATATSVPNGALAPAPSEPAIGMAEIALVDAPVSAALQLLLASARFSCSSDPSVTGTVTYSCTKTPKPFWEVLGRVIGAAPAPGVHVVAIWDSYRVLPRNVRPTSMRDYVPQAAPAPDPVPLSEGKATHRMAGFVSLKPSDDQPNVEYALLETRIPGMVPVTRLIRLGESLQRKSSEAVARETNAAENIDVAVAVTEIAVDHVTLTGGGNKSLRVPLSDTGVEDVFGFSREKAITSGENGAIPGDDPRSGWHP